MTAARSASACHAHWLKRTESSRTEDGIRSWVRFLAMSFRFPRFFPWCAVEALALIRGSGFRRPGPCEGRNIVCHGRMGIAMRCCFPAASCCLATPDCSRLCLLECFVDLQALLQM